jgi:hypothetical protein
MKILNTGEPFGLPKGTVRGIIALVCLGLIVYDFVVDQQFSAEILAFSGPYLGFYFGTRANAPDVEVLDEPAL